MTQTMNQIPLTVYATAEGEPHKVQDRTVERGDPLNPFADVQEALNLTTHRPLLVRDPQEKPDRNLLHEEPAPAPVPEVQGAPQGLEHAQMRKLIQRINHLAKLHPRVVGTLLTHEVPTTMEEIASPYRRTNPVMALSGESEPHDAMLGANQTGAGMHTMVVLLQHLLSCCVDTDGRFPGQDLVTLDFGTADRRCVKLVLKD